MSNFSSVNAQSLPVIPIIPDANTNDNTPTNDILNGIVQQEQVHIIPFDPLAGNPLTQYPDSQNYPYLDPYQIPESPVQTLPGDLFPLEEQQLLSQENSIADASTPETTINSVFDGNNVPLQEGITTTSNKIVLTVQGADDSAVTGYQCVLDNIQQDPSVCSTNPVVAENLPPGAHLFQIISVDTAGNVDPTPAFFSWNVAISDQYLGGQQMSQDVQQLLQPIVPSQQLPMLLLQEQTVLPYQTNISPYMTDVPNLSNSNATIINENQQPLPSQNFQAANPIQVPPQYTTTDSYQNLDGKQYQYQQNLHLPLQQPSQNISSMQEPPTTYSLSPFITPLFDYTQLRQQQKQIVTTAANTTNETTQIPSITNPTFPTSTDLESENEDSQSFAVDNNVRGIDGGSQSVSLTDNSTTKPEQSLSSTLPAIDNSTSTNNSSQDIVMASISSTIGSFIVEDHRSVDFGVAEGHHGQYTWDIKYNGEISLNEKTNTATVSSVHGACVFISKDNGVVNDRHTENPTL